MDNKQKATDEEKTFEDMPETGGDIKAVDQESTGQKGGEAAQKKEEESSNEFGQKDSQSEDSGNKPSESDDLWGQE